MSTPISQETERDRPVIEITPEMIEAGAQVIESACDMGSYGDFGATQVARDVFLAMLGKRP